MLKVRADQMAKARENTAQFRLLTMARAGRIIAGCALIYATVELWSTEILRRLASSTTFITTHRPFFLAWLCTFIIAGFVVGFVMAAALKRTETPWREIGTLLLALAIGVNVVVHRHLSILPVVVIALVLVCVAAFAAIHDQDRRRLRVWTSPWTASVLLVLPDWIANDLFVNAPNAIRGIAFVVAVVAFAVLCFLLFRLSERRSQSRPAVPAIVILATIIIALFVREAAPKQWPVPKLSRKLSAPNVLLITMDTVRADHLSIYGYDRDTTPSLARFLSDATLYRTAIAPSNLTLGSHASLFTGLYPSEHRAHYDKGWPGGRPLDRRITTLAEMLSKRGYDCSAVVANYFFLSTDYGLDRGFSFYSLRHGASVNAPFTRPRQPGPHSGKKKHLLGHAMRSLLCDRLHLFSRLQHYVTAAELTRAAVARVDHANEVGRPFFIFVNYMDAHTPFLPPAPYDRRFPGRNPKASPLPFPQVEHLWARTGRLEMSPAAREHFTSQYDGGIAYIDDSIGKLLQALRDRGVYDDTLVVITSDHGEALGEHETVGHGSSTFNEQVHVPLVVKLPRQRSNSVIAEPVSLVDAFSLMQSAGERPIPALAEAVAEGHPLVASRSTPAVYRPGRAIIRGGFKFIRSARSKDGELYDLRRDPKETRNLIRIERARAEELGNALDQWARNHRPRYASYSGVVISREAEARLRAVGYIR